VSQKSAVGSNKTQNSKNKEEQGWLFLENHQVMLD
jgi:hypothetical protein